ncbi:Hsp20/alpha crystallin family protein [Mycolicibacterium sp.]|uniref:Hsp20/alpha crystallin family protein n=1 Tax=Mycolicibacterium sp. TaxID=2320850 RepID=UPI001D44F3CC|nr:Hsp20/alpha crystallin family protein [Mycolicibacterium sp.]MCB1290601.1 Hsp20/alpha crystallin family protein [Mycobacterium sp.]MCB9410547.1 Hsp20/alpha crystallin family protein [Mycolicibacterium sp.]
MSNVALWSRPTWTVDHMLRDLFGPAMQVAGANEAFPSGFNPAAEVIKDGEDAVVRLEIPGVDVDRDVKVELDAGRLVISGERRDEHAENTEGRTVREVRYGSFQRSFAVPAHVNADAITASYDAGVLSVRVRGAYAGSTAQRIAINR